MVNLNAASIYVSVKGDDNNNGLSPSFPKNTPQLAFDLINAGDTLFFMEGEYSTANGESILKITKVAHPKSGFIFEIIETIKWYYIAIKNLQLSSKERHTYQSLGLT
ncbi:MAG: hypothetical protein IPJ43_21805 [Saprospiraceae bacterium]|nr:hypothetical protein [Saprospiraceae bacterium]